MPEHTNKIYHVLSNFYIISRLHLGPISTLKWSNNLKICNLIFFRLHLNDSENFERRKGEGGRVEKSIWFWQLSLLSSTCQSPEQYGSFEVSWNQFASDCLDQSPGFYQYKMICCNFIKMFWAHSLTCHLHFKPSSKSRINSMKLEELPHVFLFHSYLSFPLPVIFIKNALDWAIDYRMPPFDFGCQAILPAHNTRGSAASNETLLGLHRLGCIRRAISKRLLRAQGDGVGLLQLLWIVSHSLLEKK